MKTLKVGYSLDALCSSPVRIFYIKSKEMNIKKSAVRILKMELKVTFLKWRTKKKIWT
jgi:hypothetical protein